ncbi:MAG: hypothetical protein ACTSP2_10315, partial [Alphaproteobacteria bacterium]
MIELAHIDRACPQCSSRENTVLERYSRAPWEVVGCNDCGFVFLGNPPDYVRLEDELAWEKSYVEERKRRVRDRPVVEVLENLTSWRRR